MNKYAALTPKVLHILKDKGTEAAFSGNYLEAGTAGTYLCRGCGLALFRGDSQFTSTCGWPSFDDEIENAILRQQDADGRRVEILCNRCHGHLGHVFQGEDYTEKDLRHCVNSLAVDFVVDEAVLDTEEAILAAGCFWGVEALLQKLPGVLFTEVGYIGGSVTDPNYEMVCQGDTGHLEAVRVIYDPQRISYQQLLKYFFEIHDPEQGDGQGPDIGSQYLSAIFYFDEAQQVQTKEVLQQLQQLGYHPKTQLYPVQTFWSAELYHQDYYTKTGKQPYCHIWQKKFA